MEKSISTKCSACHNNGIFVGIVFENGVEYKIFKCEKVGCGLEWLVQNG